MWVTAGRDGDGPPVPRLRTSLATSTGSSCHIGRRSRGPTKVSRSWISCCIRPACSGGQAQIVADVVLSEIVEAVDHRLEETAHHGEGRTHLVGHVGDEIPPHRLDPLPWVMSSDSSRRMSSLKGTMVTTRRADGPADREGERRRVIARFQVAHEIGLPDDVGDGVPWSRTRSRPNCCSPW